jgi:hypothetical protein
MVSISLLVGLRVSRRSPPMDRTTSPMPRFDRSASIVRSSAVLRASLSGFVTISVSPFAEELQAGFQRVALRHAADLFIENLSAPAAVRSVVLVRAYPIIKAGACYRCPSQGSDSVSSEDGGGGKRLPLTNVSPATHQLRGSMTNVLPTECVEKPVEIPSRFDLIPAKRLAFLRDDETLGMP